MKTALITLTICLFLISSNTFAEGEGSYLGLSVGQSTTDTGITNTTGTASVDDEDTGYKIFLGININQYIAVEGFYVNFGEATLKGNTGDTFQFAGNTGQFTQNNVQDKIEGKSFGVASLFGYPVHQFFNPYVKLGFHFWETEASSNVSNVSLGDDGIDYLYGGGFNTVITKHFGFRAEFERYNCDDEEVDMYSAGLKVMF